jgi:hypothetical protein
MTEPLTAVTLFLRLDATTAESHASRLLVTRSPMQRKPCWSLSQKIDMIDTVLRGWACPPIYMITHAYKKDLCSEGEDWVFDGAHKLESVFEFMKDGFAFTPGPTTGSELAALAGKKFSGLLPTMKDRIRKYTFIINWIPTTTAEDPDQLRILWERLNRAGVKLNDFELSIPTIAPLIETVLRPAMETFIGTPLFPGTASKRGVLEQRLQLILALFDISEFKGSQNALIKEWQLKELGDTMARRAEAVATKGVLWSERLLRCHKMLMDLKDLAVFYDPETGEEDIADAVRKTELPFVLGCLGRIFERIEDFRSQKVAIAGRLRTEIFSKTPEDLLSAVGGTGRNGTFQRKLLKMILQLAEGSKELVQPRRFTKKMQREVLTKQGGVCPSCSKPILKEQLFDGDHVLPWSEGGETTADNLQVLHRHCHQEKTATMVSLTA